MEQLLSIKHIPIKVEVNVQRAELKPVENNASAPSVQVSAKQGGGLRVEANPYRVDLSESRNFDSFVPSANSASSFSLTYEAIAKIAEGGSVQGADNSQFAAQKSKSIEAVLQSLPKGKNNAVSYADGTLSINYQMQGNNPVDIQADMAGFEFVPGSIEFIVTQMPEVDIEYLGEPIYFPRSASPNYEAPLDVMA